MDYRKHMKGKGAEEYRKAINAWNEIDDETPAYIGNCRYTGNV